MAATHTYRCELAWDGSTALGYDRYLREHTVRLPPAADPLRVSADPTFLGDPGCANPEALLLAAASSCQLLSFLARAARSRIDVLGYRDDAEAIMPEDDPPIRITEIRLRPTITVAAGTAEARVRRLVERAHADCFIANSLTSAMTIEPAIVIAS